MNQRPLPVSKAIVVPSGDHEGFCSSMRGVNVSRRLSLPLAFILQTSARTPPRT
jgi:hypothetical protein